LFLSLIQPDLVSPHLLVATLSHRVAINHRDGRYFSDRFLIGKGVIQTKI
jgi:hypothetical protein